MILDIAFYISCFIILLIVPLEVFAYIRTKNKIFNCMRRNISRKTKKRLSNNIEQLFDEINSLSPDIFRKLKLHAGSPPEESYIVKMFNLLLSILAVLFAAMALLGSWMGSPFPSSLLSESSEHIIWLLKFLSIVAIMFFAITIHIIATDYERKFKQRLIVVINEVEKKQPLTVRLSEAQYQVLLASADRRQY
ncbi:hypothetical protein [Paenibacillus sp. GXUN7292]|uniref:hypothetical protein n=1 Tax=Paenibacillus sp. GXUN7292 TaxID=3422499 RepID=UPI003D7E8E7B